MTHEHDQPLGSSSSGDTESSTNTNDDSGFRFVPFSEQQGDIKLHRITLSITFPQSLSAPRWEERTCTRCKSKLRQRIIDYRFAWGQTERLECVVPNTPVWQCACTRIMEDHIAWPIKQRASVIDRYISFQKDEDLQSMTSFIDEQDRAKVKDLAQAIREHPWFVHEGSARQDSSAKAPS